MRRHRKLLIALAALLFVLASRTPGGGLLWILLGGLLGYCSWRLRSSMMRRWRRQQWDAALHRAAEGWPTTRDRLLLRTDQIYRGTVASLGVFLVLYGLIRLSV